MAYMRFMPVRAWKAALRINLDHLGSNSRYEGGTKSGAFNSSALLSRERSEPIGTRLNRAQ